MMALTIATGFVVDDAIVVIENVSRYLEQGYSPMDAAIKGAAEIGFTVLSISISLVAVFIPILMMSGIVGRLFREFAVTLSVAIIISLVISLTTTPMMCARLLKHQAESAHNKLYQASERAFNRVLAIYERTLSWVLNHSALTLTVLLLTIGAECLSFLSSCPFGFFPQQDNGTVFGGIQGEQDISFQAMQGITMQFVDIIKSDPAAQNVMAFTGGAGAVNGGFIYMALKPLNERKISASDVINRLRPKLLAVPGATAFLQAGQDVRIGGRQSSAQYQYTIQSDNLDDLVTWGPTLLTAMRKQHMLTDVNTDQQNSGLEAALVYDRETASRLGITPKQIDTYLVRSFRSAASLYYVHVAESISRGHGGRAAVLAKPRCIEKCLRGGFRREKKSRLTQSRISSRRTAALAVNHQGQFPSVTVSFNLAPGVSLSDAAKAITDMEQKIGMPTTIHGMFSGTLQAFQASLSTEPLLIITALMAVYIVLGILYESYRSPHHHPLHSPLRGRRRGTGVLIFKMDLSVIAIIGDHPAHWHRQEERHIDDRLRSRRRAPGKKISGRRHLSSLLAALPSHFDDHHGRHIRRAPPRFGYRHWFGIAASTGNHHHRWPDHEPDVDALHHSRRLSLYGSLLIELSVGRANITSSSISFLKKHWGTLLTNSHHGAEVVKHRSNTTSLISPRQIMASVLAAAPCFPDAP